MGVTVSISLPQGSGWPWLFTRAPSHHPQEDTVSLVPQRRKLRPREGRSWSNSTEMVEPGFETKLHLTSEHKLSPKAAKTPNPGPLNTQPRSSGQIPPAPQCGRLARQPLSEGGPPPTQVHTVQPAPARSPPSPRQSPSGWGRAR